MKRRGKGGIFATILFSLVSILYLAPLFIVLINSFKKKAFINLEPFKLPTEKNFIGLENFTNAIENYDFLMAVVWNLVMTVGSVVVILVCTSMFAWFITRVNNRATKFLYLLCVFSMVVPFQMVMFTLSKTANTLHLNTPWTIPIIYLGFGAGLAIFMFVGFVKSIPLEIEEAAAIDGCGPLRTYFSVVVPMLKPTMVSVGDSGDYVGVERLPPALPGAGQEPVPHHPHPHPVPEGQLRHRGPGRHYGPDPAVHYPGDCVLPHLPEAHHRGRSRWRGEGLSLAF